MLGFEDGHDLGDASFTLGARHVVIQKCELNIFGNSKFVDQVKTLEYETNVLLANVCALRLSVLRDVLVEKEVITI